MKAQYLDSKDGVFRDIPQAPYYVLSNDTCLSGWIGAPTEGKTNVCVVPCQDYETASRIELYIKTKRTDQERVRIVTTPPRSKPGVVYSLLDAWIETSKHVLGE